jgi:hypothetical protein
MNAVGLTTCSDGIMTSVAGGAVTALALFLIFRPEAQRPAETDGRSEEWRLDLKVLNDKWDDPAEQRRWIADGLNILRQKLRDPSTKLRNVRIVRASNKVDPVTCSEFSVKGSGYVKFLAGGAFVTLGNQGVKAAQAAFAETWPLWCKP